MKDPVNVLFHPLNRIISVERGTTVLDAIRKAGIQFESICGGKGECNKCKVIHVRGECDAGSPLSTKGLSSHEIALHYCRACQTRILGDCEFVIPVESRIDSPQILLSYTIPPHHHDPAVKKYLVVHDAGPAIPLPGHRSMKLAGYTGIRPRMTKEQQEKLFNAGTLQTVTVSTTSVHPEIIRIEDGDTTPACYGIALDIGITTVAGILMDLGTGKVCAEASGLNLQITHGEELLTRIGVARKPEGREQLRESAVRSANEVISRLVAGAKISNDLVCDVCLAGNTVMQYLFLGRDPSLLEIANTEVPRAPVLLRAQDAGLHVNPGAWVYCLPVVSRFIGGDAVGCVVASGMHLSSDISLMIDLGTNGEVILGNRDWLASVS
ncbi:MAG: 2Fe-2S iron-sulfur cluster binding domain-containing protein, partial [Methanomicrobiales archaeon]|nr:2Fe-2S iron-sulfur cluster binding domain-containing protein [Methanomicrobiales archaeon]